MSASADIAEASPELPRVDTPRELNWNQWLGQAPLVDYVAGPPRGRRAPQSRCHVEFRWWYEYSGGKLTDWGAHHVDIAQWAIGMEHSGPVSVEGVAEHPCPMKNGYPTVDNRYNAATSFTINCRFPNGVELVIRDSHEDFANGILIEGTEAQIFVSRAKLSGEPIADLKSNPLPADALVKLCKGKDPGGHRGNNHMRNFFECIPSRDVPISDVYTHHRSVTTCHLANIAIRLGRKIEWNPETEQIVGDPEAAQWQAREQRRGFEVVA